MHFYGLGGGHGMIEGVHCAIVDTIRLSMYRTSL
jgi:hypothetical protein